MVTKSLSLPDAAHEFPARKAKTFLIEELRVALHGRSFADRAESGNFAVDYPEPKPGWLNIGVLHSSLDGRPGHANYAPCALTDLRAKNYDYWALGHVHAHEIVCENPFVVYPGNLQGRSIRECGEKGAVLVDVEDGAVKGLRRLIVDRARFAEILIDAWRACETPAEFLREISARAAQAIEGAAGRFLAARLRVQGRERAAFRSWPPIPRAGANRSKPRCTMAATPSSWKNFWSRPARQKKKRGGQGATANSISPPCSTRFCADPAFAEEALTAISVIEAKMPPKSELPREIFAALLGEARELALARAERPA